MNSSIETEQIILNGQIRLQRYVDEFTKWMAEMVVKYIEIRVNEKILFHVREILGSNHIEILSLPINYNVLKNECWKNLI